MPATERSKLKITRRNKRKTFPKWTQVTFPPKYIDMCDWITLVDVAFPVISLRLQIAEYINASPLSIAITTTMITIRLTFNVNPVLIRTVAITRMPLNGTDGVLSFISERPGLFDNTLKPKQNDHDFAGDIFKSVFFYENCSIFIQISLKFVPKDSFSNIPSLGQKMAWRGIGDEPLSEQMMT